MSSSDEYYTPISLFAYLGLTFDLDVAAPIGGIPWIPTLKYYTKEDDRLANAMPATLNSLLLPSR